MKMRADAVGFLRSNGKFLALAALALSAVLVALVFLLPDEYQKDVSLEVRPSLSELQEALGQAEPASRERISRLALAGLRGADLGSVEVTPMYDSGSQTIDLRMFSSERGPLEEASTAAASSMEDHIEKTYADSLGSAVENQLVTLNKALQDNQEYLDNIEGQLDALPPGNPSLGSVEDLRDGALDSRARIESKVDYLERAREDLPGYTSGVASVEVVDESEVRRAGSPVPLIPYAILLALLAAVAGTLRSSATRNKEPLPEKGRDCSNV